ncbi:Crp/Fnr family transcriptional regulator [Tabrizicola sp.]|uniref:Crp/Fnr family transcriptional regulator n=1 Tax=Tabrizicola sp. TaxID=2005166 RepID=UPI00261782B3|nr:Crp/Fnr family transcriptional regulator [Tabrizicola sp.]MDM7932485.1 Crp/Fnr family transcriptional regulator [Tabrizicola sp.]
MQTKPATSDDQIRKDRAVWRSFPIFRAADDDVLAELPRVALRRRWNAGEVIFEKGDPGDFMLALTQGRMKLSNLSQNGRELLIRIAEAGDLVGEIACLDGAERSSAATAVTRVEALVLSRKDYREIASRFPALHEAAIGHLGALLRGTNDRLESVSLYQLHARFARFLLFSLHQMNGEDLEAFEMLGLNVNQTDLGLLVGASRPKLNRMLQEFRELGVLEQDGTVWRCNVAALRQIAEE